MSPRRLLVLLAAVASALALAAPALAAPDMGAFQVQMQPKGDVAGAQPKCTPDIMANPMALIGGGDVTCVMSASGSGTSEGTVANPSLATSTGDAGFNDGTITATCDSAQKMTMVMTFAGFQPTLKSMTGAMFQMCAFRMTFTDADSSVLEGTIEMNGSANKGDGDEDGTNIVLQMDAKVFITDGSGAFEGQVGSGEFNRTNTVPFGGGGDAGGGGGGGGGGGAVTDAEQAVCDAMIPVPDPCAAGIVDAVCGNAGWRAAPGHDTLCTAATRRLALRPTLRASVRAGDASPMTMKLSKKAGAVRILLPRPKAGKTAKVTDDTGTIKIVATAGAVCVVRTDKGKAVGSGKSKRGSRPVSVTLKAGPMAKASKIQATCTLNGKKFFSQKVKVS